MKYSTDFHFISLIITFDGWVSRGRKFYFLFSNYLLAAEKMRKDLTNSVCSFWGNKRFLPHGVSRHEGGAVAYLKLSWRAWRRSWSRTRPRTGQQSVYRGCRSGWWSSPSVCSGRRRPSSTRSRLRIKDNTKTNMKRRILFFWRWLKVMYNV